MSNITHHLKYLVSSEYRRQFRFEERHRRIQSAIESYVDELPRCHGWVLLASRADKQDGFHCDVTMRARDLLSWARQNADKRVTQNFQAEVVRKALPLWLARASFDERTVSLLPPAAFREIAGEITMWVSQGSARVYCPQCRSAINDIVVAEENVAEAVNALKWWTDVWTCPEGHVLREKDQYIRFMRAPRRS